MAWDEAKRLHQMALELQEGAVLTPDTNHQWTKSDRMYSIDPAQQE